MKKPSLLKVILLTAIILFIIFYFAGVNSIPFHPDESTQIFMSGDFELFFKNPSNIFWKPEQEQDLRQLYRERDAPLTRYLIALSRLISHKSALQADWDWSKTWEENQAAGALPDENLLLITRLGVCWLFPLSLWLIYQTAKTVGSQLSAWCTVFVFGLNALILLHTRRAMAESVLVFSELLFFWLLVHEEKSPWLLAIPAALALNSKHSSGVLIFIGIVAILWSPQFLKLDWQKLAKQFFLYLVIFASITLILNPFLWSDPFQATLAAWNSRQDLLQRQVSTISALQPGIILSSLPERFLGLIANLFLTPPAIAEVTNYLVQTQSSEIVYLSNPLHFILRNFIGGGLLLSLTLAGLIFSIRSSFRSADPLISRRRIWLLNAAALIQFLSLGIFIPLPWQRYVMPLVPYICIYLGFTVDTLRLIKKGVVQPPHKLT